MATPKDIPAKKLIDEVAKDLKDRIKFKRPDWAIFVKTGADKERAPNDNDWWWTRAASILRKIYISKNPVGVQRLRVAYGGRKHRGVKPEKFYKASGKIIRTILQEFDALGFTEKKDKKGRVITKKGAEYLNKISDRLLAS
ncbi:MAG: 30S ribosomal protein S19e [Candidatus Altiarchaeota archaeon]